MSHDLTTTAAELARLTGLSLRQVQRKARFGEIPGCVLSKDGYHRSFNVTDETRAWIARESRRVSKRIGAREKDAQGSSKPKLRVRNEVMEAMCKVGKLRQFFDEWTKREPVESWDKAVRQSIIDQLQPLVGLHTELEHVKLRSRRGGR
jgi:hypothetical protein